MIGYLDIETDAGGTVTVVGLLRTDRGLLQLVGDAITADALRGALDGLDTICTFYGEGFDLPVLRRALGLDLLVDYRSLDLSALCKRLGIRGGLKAIEAALGIGRGSAGLNGTDAIALWERWRAGDRDALETLLAYNRDDVRNLVTLERRLHGDLATPSDPPLVVVGA